jgi:hypothetical protein
MVSVPQNLCFVDLGFNLRLDFCFPAELFLSPKATSWFPDLLLDSWVNFCFPAELFQVFFQNLNILQAEFKSMVQHGVMNGDDDNASMTDMLRDMSLTMSIMFRNVFVLPLKDFQ